MLPPNLEPDFLARVALRMIETFQIALVGAVLGIVVSLPIAWCAARGVSPLGRGNILVKAFISFLRTFRIWSGRCSLWPRSGLGQWRAR